MSFCCWQDLSKHNKIIDKKSKHTKPFLKKLYKVALTVKFYKLPFTLEELKQKEEIKYLGFVTTYQPPGKLFLGNLKVKHSQFVWGFKT